MGMGIGYVFCSGGERVPTSPSRRRRLADGSWVAAWLVPVTPPTPSSEDPGVPRACIVSVELLPVFLAVA